MIGDALVPQYGPEAGLVPNGAEGQSVGIRIQWGSIEVRLRQIVQNAAENAAVVPNAVNAEVLRPPI